MHMIAKHVGIGVCLFIWSGCLIRPDRPLLYHPTFDLTSVMALRLPERVATLHGCANADVVVKDGVNQRVGGRQPDNIQELFYIRKSGVEYQCILFASEAAAIRWYTTEMDNPMARRYYPLFHEEIADGRSACVFYTYQPRSDPEGGSGPMGYYVSQANFRLRNAFVRVTVQDDKPESEKLSYAIAELASMLEEDMVGQKTSGLDS